MRDAKPGAATPAARLATITAPHTHEPDHHHHGGHGLVDESIKRSREGLRAVGLSLAATTPALNSYVSQ
jgi:hypothetical protein